MTDPSIVQCFAKQTSTIHLQLWHAQWAILGILSDALPCHYPNCLLCKQGIWKLDLELNEGRWAVTVESSHGFSVSSEHTKPQGKLLEDERPQMSVAKKSTQGGVSNIWTRRRSIDWWWDLFSNIDPLHSNKRTLLELILTDRIIDSSRHTDVRGHTCTQTYSPSILQIVCLF